MSKRELSGNRGVVGKRGPEGPVSSLVFPGRGDNVEGLFLADELLLQFPRMMTQSWSLFLSGIGGVR